jgi:hypothetical protein
VSNGSQYVIDTSGFENDIDVNKQLYNVMITLGTSSKTHKFIGNNGVITSDVNNESIQPVYKFDSKEFYLISDSKFATNTIFDGERSFFN